MLYLSFKRVIKLPFDDKNIAFYGMVKIIYKCFVCFLKWNQRKPFYEHLWKSTE